MPLPSSAGPGGLPGGSKLEIYRELISAATIPVEVIKLMGERQVKLQKPKKKDADRAKRLADLNKRRRGRSLEKRTRIIE